MYMPLYDSCYLWDTGDPVTNQAPYICDTVQANLSSCWKVKLKTIQQISLLDTWEGNNVTDYSLVGVTPCSIVVYCLRLEDACSSIHNVFDYTEDRGNILLRNVGSPVTVCVRL
jgi:hypothetical protein